MLFTSQWGDLEDVRDVERRDTVRGIGLASCERNHVSPSYITLNVSIVF